MPPSSRGGAPVDPEPGPLHSRQLRDKHDPDPGDPTWTQASSHTIGTMMQFLRRIGTALIGGDFTGSARGLNAVDIQNTRTHYSNVASGLRAIAFGNDNEASGEDAIALGKECVADDTRAIAVGSGAHSHDTATLAVGQDAAATGVFGIAIGPGATSGAALVAEHTLAVGCHSHVTGDQGTAMGSYAHVLGSRSTALGANARARLDDSLVAAGVITTRRSGLTQDAHEDALSLGYLPLHHGAGALVTIASNDLDLTSAAAACAIAFPTGCRFFVRDFSVIVTAATSVTVQPTVRAGTLATKDGLLAAQLTVGLTAAGLHNRFFLAPWETALTDIHGSLTVGATATAMHGRFVWTGHLVEDELPLDG